MFYIQFRDSFDKEKQTFEYRESCRLIINSFFDRRCPRRRRRNCLNPLVMLLTVFFLVLLGTLREIMDEQLALELSRNVSIS